MAQVSAPRKGSAKARAAHPLDPLTADEIKAAVDIVRQSGKLGERGRFSTVTLYEPDKEIVRNFRPGSEIDRCAAVVVLDEESGETYAGVVSITHSEIRDWTRVGQGQASLGFEDFIRSYQLIKTDPRWQEAMRKRGIKDEEFERMQIDSWIPGHFSLPVEEGHRLTRPVSYYREREGDNGYARPVEGVLAFVDPLRGEVLEVQDHGVVPIPPENGRYDAESVGKLREGLKPIEITQPEGASFTVDGSEVSWQNWRFRVSLHPIEGLVLHTVGYEDGGRLRSILYRAALSEMVVPYASTSPMHYWKNAFDAGEVGLGKLVNSLELGCDCVGNIYYFDAYTADGNGEPQHRANAICMHEEDYGVLWKHTELASGHAEVRRSRRLVVSSFHTVGNYDYGFFWYFYLDGSLQLEIKMTGILQTQAVAPGADPGNAVMIAPQLAAPHHQHLFNYRLDFDVDGAENSVYEVDVEPLAEGPDNPYYNAFTTKTTSLESESSAQRMADPSRSRSWKVVNESSRNRLGQPVAYRIVPGPTPALLAGPQAVVKKRATFATKNLWVTPFSPFEMHAAGDFPNQNPGGAGLPEWTKANRSTKDTDVVVWYTFGATHIARPEDWPIFPVEYVGFMLQPAGFFDRNPALDVPRPMNGHCADN
jgi:primary-amine oxidase